jgi:hypothetical protein
MSNLRNVNDDIIKDWLLFRDETICTILNSEDKKHLIYFDEICEKILNSIPKQNRAFVQKQLDQLDNNFMDYVSYWNEKYYRNGFCDAVELVSRCFK